MEDQHLGPLCHYVPFVSIYDIDSIMADSFQEGYWNFNQLATLISKEIKHLGNGLVLDDVLDGWVWDHSLNGTYSTKEGYKWITNLGNSTS